MDAAELETYQYQLTQVTEALSMDPGNADLLRLKQDLSDLIELTRSAASSAPSEPTPAREVREAPSVSAPSTSAPVVPGGTSRPTHSPTRSAGGGGESRLWKVGDRIMALWKGDGAWYSARVMSVGGSDASRMYSVQFQGYDTNELVSQAETRAREGKGGPARQHQHQPQSLPPSQSQHLPQHLSNPISTDPGHKREESSFVSTPIAQSTLPTTVALPVLGEEEEKKKKKTGNKRFGETVQKQKAWLAFAKGGKGKGGGVVKKSSILSRTSMFASNPNGRVGIIGSEKPMTRFEDRGKHRFNLDEGSNQ